MREFLDTLGSPEEIIKVLEAAAPFIKETVNKIAFRCLIDELISNSYAFF